MAGKGEAKIISTGWSDWVWDTPNARWYRGRLGFDGTYDEYEYSVPSQPSSETQPRSRQEGPTQPPEMAQNLYDQDYLGYQKETVRPALFYEGYQTISHPSRFFKVGRMFKVLWTEPAGNVSDSDYGFMTPVQFGEMAFTKIRPFVVIREMQGCCLCLPVNTFSYQGTEKDSIRATDYAAVYPMGGNPQIGASEKMTKEPIPIIVEDPNERIDPMSRLNFGQVYTIQHNLKVLRIGRIPVEYLSRLNHYFRETIEGTFTEDPVGVSVAFGSLSLKADERPTSNHGVGEFTQTLESSLYDTSQASVRGFGVSSVLPNPLSLPFIPLSGYYPYLPNQEATAALAFESDAQSSIQNTINTNRTPGTTEKPNPLFRVHNSRYFKPGSAFKVMWSEPSGEYSSIEAFRSSSDGKLVHTGIRRFVIVASDYGHSQCLPIFTYSGNGTAKKGAKREQHAIIYTGNTPPRELPGEPPLEHPAIELIPKTPRDKLALESRINYAKIYTVEHNVKVIFFGKVATSSEKPFVASFDSTWSNKKQMDLGL